MMWSKNSLSWTVVVLQVARVLTAPAVSQLDIVIRGVDHVADDVVNTPAGPFLRSKVHPVPQGARAAHADNLIHIISSDGTTLNTATFSKNTVSRHNIGAPSRRAAAFAEGYVVSPYWHNTSPSPIAYFSTSWTVPSIPETVDGQILYLFNSIEPDNFESVIQPVLQFGTTPAGGGNYWAIVSWFVIGSDVYYTPLTQVFSGQTITGVITLEHTIKDLNTNTTSFAYNSVFEGVPISSLSISSNFELTWLQESLEIHGPTGPTELPRGRTTMSFINVLNQDGLRPTVSWAPCDSIGVTDTADGFGCSIVIDSGNNGEVDIIYPLE